MKITSVPAVLVEPAAVRVARGMAALPREMLDNVDLDRLDISSGLNCVLGQFYQDGYSSDEAAALIASLDPEVQSQDADGEYDNRLITWIAYRHGLHGFKTYAWYTQGDVETPEYHEDIEELNQAWLAALREQRGLVQV